MTKDNFICPCCGLPNHLELNSKEDYNTIRNIEEGVDERITGDFTHYIVDEDVETVAKELYKRYSEILDIYPTYNGINYDEWFDNNVVCLIKDEDEGD